MAKEVQKNEAKEVQKGEAKEVKIATISKAFEIEALKGCKNRDDAATKIVALLNKNGVTKTKNGELTVERVKKQLGNMLTHISKAKNLQKRWAPFKLEETETQLKLVRAN